jgi:hypothetical protein
LQENQLNCAQPLATAPLPVSGFVVRDPVLRVASLYHASVVEGPGRRSVLQVQGCPLRCSLVIYSTGAPIPPRLAADWLDINW